MAPPVTLLPRAQHTMSSIRLGVFGPWVEHADPEVVACTQSALSTAVDLGAQVRCLCWQTCRSAGLHICMIMQMCTRMTGRSRFVPPQSADKLSSLVHAGL